MSTIALWNSLVANGLPAAVSAAPARLSPPPLTVVSAFRLSPVRKPQVITIFHRSARPAFLVQAVAGDELGSEKKTQKGALGGLAVVEEETNGAASGIPELKRKLIDQLFGTDRGLKATSETRAEVNEIISQLETKNPTPAPTEALSLLNGKWILAYTSFVGLFPLLGAGNLTQLVKVDEISQTIDSEALTVQNSVRFVGPFSTTSVSTNAKFEVRSPKRVQDNMSSRMSGTSRQIVCHCGLQTALLTSRQPHSYGRRFYTCPRSIAEQCRFFRWAESSVDSDDDDGSDLQVVVEGAQTRDLQRVIVRNNITIMLLVIVIVLQFFFTLLLVAAG